MPRRSITTRQPKDCLISQFRANRRSISRPIAARCGRRVGRSPPSQSTRLRAIWSQASLDLASRSSGGTRVHTRSTVMPPTRSGQCRQLAANNDEVPGDAELDRAPRNPVPFTTHCNVSTNESWCSAFVLSSVSWTLSGVSAALSRTTGRPFTQSCCDWRPRTSFSRPSGHHRNNPSRGSQPADIGGRLRTLHPRLEPCRV